MGSPWDWEDGPPMARRMTRPAMDAEKLGIGIAIVESATKSVNLVGQESMMIYLILFDDELKLTNYYLCIDDIFDDEVDTFYHQLLVVYC